MNSLALTFMVANAIALLALPRRWAPLPLLVGACFMPLGEALQLGPFSLSVLRVLIAFCLTRVILRGERFEGDLNSVDRFMVIWALWAVISGLFHDDVLGALVNRLGAVYNACGIYFLLRIVCRSQDDTVRLCRMTAFLLTPVALEMLLEKTTGHNLFFALGGVSELSDVRDGIVRANGPFAHPILAGTVGAASLPLMIGIWRQFPKTAIMGMIACVTMIAASASSGPIWSSIFGIVALLMWYWRTRMRFVRWGAVLGYIGLELVMNAPAYYIITYIDLTGSSTSWHRAALIEAALMHLSEWWFAGTDYTRHWIAYGVGWSANHIDITNYYIRMGVDGGLPLMFLFISTLAGSFALVGKAARQVSNSSTSRFMIWALGASLFAHAASFISVSYFDQSFLFLYLTMAAISAAAVEPVAFREKRPSHITIRRPHTGIGQVRR